MHIDQWSEICPWHDRDERKNNNKRIQTGRGNLFISLNAAKNAWAKLGRAEEVVALIAIATREIRDSPAIFESI